MEVNPQGLRYTQSGFVLHILSHTGELQEDSALNGMREDFLAGFRNNTKPLWVYLSPCGFTSK